MSVSIAIDGPVGAGKSTIAKFCAKALGFIYVDTGALYRAIGLYCHENGINMDDADAVSAVLPKILLEIKLIDGTQHILTNGRDVSVEIRLPEISMAASKVSAIPEVRAFLLDLQRNFAKKQNVIMDGRDIGTVVLPNADLKIFLTADARERAKRRYDELIAKGSVVKYEDVLDDLNKRDYNDSHRAIAPLKQADDAVLADTTGMNFEQSCDMIIAMIGDKTKNVL